MGKRQPERRVCGDCALFKLVLLDTGRGDCVAKLPYWLGRRSCRWVYDDHDSTGCACFRRKRAVRARP